MAAETEVYRNGRQHLFAFSRRWWRQPPGGGARGHSRPFAWLEQQPAPRLIAPAAVSASGYRLSVPNNSLDKVAEAWCRGNNSNSGDANPATHRTMKNVRPTLMIDCDAVRYLWPLAEPVSEQIRVHIERLCDVARSVVALGWGIDIVVGHGAIMSDVQAGDLPGERWSPMIGTTGAGLRIPGKRHPRCPCPSA